MDTFVEKKQWRLILCSPDRAQVRRVPSSNVPCPPRLMAATHPSHLCRTPLRLPSPRTGGQFAFFFIFYIQRTGYFMCFSADDLSIEDMRWCYNVLCFKISLGLIWSLKREKWAEKKCLRSHVETHPVPRLSPRHREGGGELYVPRSNQIKYLFLCVLNDPKPNGLIYIWYIYI